MKSAPSFGYLTSFLLCPQHSFPMLMLLNCQDSLTYTHYVSDALPAAAATTARLVLPALKSLRKPSKQTKRTCRVVLSSKPLRLMAVVRYACSSCQVTRQDGETGGNDVGDLLRCSPPCLPGNHVTPQRSQRPRSPV
eukprot:762514-Hanusia_phi.AAC.12